MLGGTTCLSLYHCLMRPRLFSTAITGLTRLVAASSATLEEHLCRTPELLV